MRAIILLSLAAVPALARPVDLRCGYLTNPLGIDQAQPRLSWRSDHTERNWTQSAYQVRVASSVTALAAGQADVWDSGKQTTSDSIGIVYAGKNLAAGRRYFWTVRVWDAQGRAEDAAEPAWFETGLLASADWKAKWISRKDPAEDAVQAALHWIWVAGQDAFAVAPKTAAVFHKEVDLSGKPAEAALFVAARGAFKAKINGQDAGAKSDFRLPRYHPVSRSEGRRARAFQRRWRLCCRFAMPAGTHSDKRAMRIGRPAWKRSLTSSPPGWSGIWPTNGWAPIRGHCRDRRVCCGASSVSPSRSAQRACM
jgi:hypothetical protein